MNHFLLSFHGESHLLGDLYWQVVEYKAVMQLLPFILEKGAAYGYIHCPKLRHERKHEI